MFSTDKVDGYGEKWKASSLWSTDYWKLRLTKNIISNVVTMLEDKVPHGLTTVIIDLSQT